MADSQELVTNCCRDAIFESEKLLVNVYANRHTLMEHACSYFDILTEQTNTLIEQSNNFKSANCVYPSS